MRFQTGKSGDPWGFVGNEEDRGSGISDFHARPYRPELGVFLAVDPVALLSPEQTIGNATRLLAYAYAGSDPITQADGNGLTFGQFVHGMWDQGVENVKAAAQATVASVRSNAALAMSGDIEGAAANVVVGAAHGMIQTVKDVGNFGNDFAKAVFAPNDYEAGRLAVKPVMTAMTVAGTVMGARMAVEKAGARKALAPTSAKRTIIIGENMRRRVIPYAERTGAEVYEGMPGFKKGMEGKGLAHNKEFIEQAKRDGARIKDVGPDFEKRAREGRASPNYEMERESTKDYPGYEKAFARSGNSSTIKEQ